MRKIKKIKTIKDLEQSIHSQIQARKSEKKPVLAVSAGTCGLYLPELVVRRVVHLKWLNL
jgi:hypothetical protein